MALAFRPPTGRTASSPAPAGGRLADGDSRAARLPAETPYWPVRTAVQARFDRRLYSCDSARDGYSLAMASGGG